MAVATIEAGGFKAVLSESNLCDVIWHLNENDEQIKKLLGHIIKNTNNSALIYEAVRREMVTESMIDFLMQTKTEDLCLWKDIIDEDMVTNHISQSFLLELMSKSDAISSAVAEDIASYKNCDTIALYEWMCEHSSEGTLCKLADARRTPKNIMGLLSAHDNESVASIAKVELKRK